MSNLFYAVQSSFGTSLACENVVDLWKKKDAYIFL